MGGTGPVIVGRIYPYINSNMLHVSGYLSCFPNYTDALIYTFSLSYWSRNFLPSPNRTHLAHWEMYVSLLPNQVLIAVISIVTPSFTLQAPKS